MWTQTNLTSAKWDGSKRQWTVELDRKKPDGTTEHRTLHPRHVIQATGHSGEMNIPCVKGMNDFQGDRLCHSSQFRGANPNSEGKKAIVVGCCNSGHGEYNTRSPMCFAIHFIHHSSGNKVEEENRSSHRL